MRKHKKPPILTRIHGKIGKTPMGKLLRQSNKRIGVKAHGRKK